MNMESITEQERNYYTKPLETIQKERDLFDNEQMKQTFTRIHEKDIRALIGFQHLERGTFAIRESRSDIWKRYADTANTVITFEELWNNMLRAVRLEEKSGVALKEWDWISQGMDFKFTWVSDIMEKSLLRREKFTVQDSVILLEQLLVICAEYKNPEWKKLQNELTQWCTNEKNVHSILQYQNRIKKSIQDEEKSKQ